DASSKLRVIREQLPIQPAFAVTGHSAQGKTLAKVIVNLHEGGFAGYVAASRAQTRHGLYITEPVTIDQLNKPLPYDLLMEVRRFEALEHNTYVRLHLLEGEAISIPDPESEREVRPLKLRPTFNTGTSVQTGRKRPAREGPVGASPSPPKVTKLEDAPRVGAAPSNVHQQLAPSAATAGCRWSPSDWSCAYDSAFMVLLYIFQSAGDQWRQRWRSSTALASGLATSYDMLMSSDMLMRSAVVFDDLRDRFRDALSALDSVAFPRHGQNGASASHILHLLTMQHMYEPQHVIQCAKGCYLSDVPVVFGHSKAALPTICDHSTWERLAGDACTASVDASSVSSQTWVKTFLQAERNRLSRTLDSSLSCNGCGRAVHPRVFYQCPPPLLTLEVVPQSCPVLFPSPRLSVPSTSRDVEYVLHGIIYLGNYHFSARLVDAVGHVWQYDGRQNCGVPTLDLPASHCLANDIFTSSSLLTSHAGSGACFLSPFRTKTYPYPIARPALHMMDMEIRWTALSGRREGSKETQYRSRFRGRRRTSWQCLHMERWLRGTLNFEALHHLAWRRFSRWLCDQSLDINRALPALVCQSGLVADRLLESWYDDRGPTFWVYEGTSCMPFTGKATKLCLLMKMGR
ncbi:hypothetical protein EV424DRAFT_1352073, partial [Suillus variegatus]